MLKKLNTFNKCLSAIVVLMIIANIYYLFFYKSWDRYNFDSSVTVPPSYPMYIEEVSFNYPHDELGISFYKSQDEVNRFGNTWGQAYYFPEAREPMRLPIELVLSYFDYRANKFYKTKIQLPTKDMKQCFEEAQEQKRFTKLYNVHGDVHGLVFLLGVANNGNIMLWLKGDNYAKLLFKKHLEPVSISKSLNYDHFKTEEQYKAKFFEYLPDSTKQKINSGWEVKANYIDSTKQFIKSSL
ncbi:Protein of unknown function [Soonwooa buanensis]|uniref:DUF2931 family protein n=1 Tax=Soonwooa buanensis TaxID=619805 RepID=A0A1T5FR59_9FLAO|nr:DUF2931 family protein [Soonwooa buanensis]SKB98678.1 Protein of unknown function [Soonwooa buanensis]